MAKLYRCKSAFSFDESGVTRVVTVDETISDDDPLFAKRRYLFDEMSLLEPLDDYVARRTARATGAETSVEQATAVPGEKRARSRAQQKDTES